MLTRRRWPSIPRVAALVWMAAIGVVSLLPEDVIRDLPARGAAPHIMAYAVLAWLLRSWPLRPAPAALGAWAYGAVVEVSQRLAGWRALEGGDLVANAAGVLLGLALDSLRRAWG